MNKVLLATCFVLFFIMLGVGTLYIDQVEKTQECAGKLEEKEREVKILQLSINEARKDFDSCRIFFDEYKKKVDEAELKIDSVKKEFAQKKCEAKKVLPRSQQVNKGEVEITSSIAADINDIYRLLDSAAGVANKGGDSP